MISTNQFKNGNHIEVDGTVFKILEFQHVKPGKGGAFVRSKLRRASDGNVIDRTFRAGEKFRAVRTEARKMQFLYADGSDGHFMDSQSFEQMAVPEGSIADSLRFMTPSSEVDVLFIDGVPSDVQLPSAVDLEVSQTDPGLRGDSVSGECAAVGEYRCFSFSSPICIAGRAGCRHCGRARPICWPNGPSARLPSSGRAPMPY